MYIFPEPGTFRAFSLLFTEQLTQQQIPEIASILEFWDNVGMISARGQSVLVDLVPQEGFWEAERFDYLRSLLVEHALAEPFMIVLDPDLHLGAYLNPPASTFDAVITAVQEHYRANPDCGELRWFEPTVGGYILVSPRV